ncbi:AbrB/MazE/SpoVT family DNA-binding domain-containing protein [Paenibacillus sp. NRS-1783]|uniref:AbrB/MazE/SpoVT family DNA-binding domain-containing protein n=1 Tax=Paenibacillus sp. NRS-1783 TaxID=3233907 RepID=UPI003D277B36
MKSTGMTRPLDSLGRIVIPKEMRTIMGYDIGDPVEFFVDDKTGLLGVRKYIGVSCKMCGAVEQLTYFRDSFICADCIGEMKNQSVSSAIPVPADTHHLDTRKEKRIYRSSQQMLDNLRKLIESDPAASQKEYAERLGLSQGRVSQLKKLL